MGAVRKTGVKGVHVVRAVRAGKPIRWFVYAWRGGPCVMKTEGPTRPDLDAKAIAAIAAAHEAENKPDPALLLSLIRQWRSESPARPSSPEWESLAPGTKKTWSSALDLIEDRWGGTPLSLWSDPRMTAKIVQWRDSRAETPRGADIGIGVLKALLDYGRLHGRVLGNVASNIPQLYRGGDRAEIIWTDDDIERFGVAALALDKPQLLDGLWLAALTGLRRQDLVTLTWAQVGDFAIVKSALKRSRRKRRFATVPRIPALDDLLAELRTRDRAAGVETVLVNSFGQSWSGDGFGGSFNAVRDEANILHTEDDDEGKPRTRKKHLHDVRGTFCTHLIVDCELSDDDTADIMAWSVGRVRQIRRTYVDQTSVVVALGERIRDMTVKRNVKRSGKAA